MAEKEKSPKSIDPATLQVLEIMKADGVDTAWDRLEAQGTQCKFGREGLCCRICNMGPCRITAKAPRGVCGADADTVVARNFLRMVAAGTAAHSDHGRGVAEMFRAMANDQAKDFQVKDPVKLREVATEFGVDTDGREVQDIARDLADLALAEFGKPTGEQTMAYPFNPNGSPDAIAGICDPSGRLFGLMPHPEAFLHRTNHPRWTREELPEEGQGVALFRNGVDFIREKLL